MASELLVFLVAGRPLLDRLGPRRALLLAALAGVIRWSAAARTALFPVLIVVEPLHGLSFALMRLACMEVIGTVVPARLALRPVRHRPFWAMALMCALALPVALMLKVTARSERSPDLL